MALQTSGAISLADISGAFPGGVNPISLNEYYGGGAYVPTGTTNYLNNLIPTGGAISLNQFYGSPNGIQLVNYIGNLLQYNRSSVVYNAAPAAQDTDNGNAFNANAPFGGGHYSIGGEAYQVCTYTNTSLPTSAGCTVVYSFAGQNENDGTNVGIAAGGTGAISDSSSATQQVGLFVYAGAHLLAPSFAYVDYREVSNNVVTVVAQYNCSASAITKIISSWDSGNYGDTYSTYGSTQIIPGHWQVSSTKLLASNVTTTMTIPPNTFQLTSQFMARDGHINNDNNNPMTTPSGIGLSIQYADHWYVNAAFQWNFNSGSSTVTASQYTNHANEAGVMYQFTQGGPGGQGVNVTGSVNPRGFGTPNIYARTSYMNLGSSSTSMIRFFPDGEAYGSGDSGSTEQDFTTYGGDTVWGWWYGATLTGTPPGNTHWIMATKANSSDPDPTGTLNTWLPLSSFQTWSFTYTGSTYDSVQLVFQIANDASGTGAVTLGGCVLSVTNGASSGGGGGGGCVTTYMMIDSARQAKDIQVGDQIDGSTYNPDGIVQRTVRRNQQQVEPCYRMTTVSGITIDASDSTPMTMKDNSMMYFGPQMVGELVLVDDRGDIRWEEVVSMEDIGPKMVVRFSVDDQSYFAGTVGDRRIATHNMPVAK